MEETSGTCTPTKIQHGRPAKPRSTAALHVEHLLTYFHTYSLTLLHTIAKCVSPSHTHTRLDPQALAHATYSLRGIGTAMSIQMQSVNLALVTPPPRARGRGGRPPCPPMRACVANCTRISVLLLLLPRHSRSKSEPADATTSVRLTWRGASGAPHAEFLFSSK